MLRPRPALLLLASGALLAATLVPTAADAAPRTATGARCTIVGTPGNDVLAGTRGRDVICGRGGDDRIDGRGGDDVIDAGAGHDTVVGGAGNDRVSGGAGKDALRGGPGTDQVSGDAGSDALFGQAGNDDVDGGRGDDELSGGPGSDDVDGGPGFNVCDSPVGTSDTQVRCVTDQLRPVIEAASATPSTVDVSATEQLVRVAAHVTDDTGVRRVQIGNVASLVSGTPRDGIWATTIRVPRFIAPGPRDLDVFVGDRVGRDSDRTLAGVYTVANTVVDLEMPVVQSLALNRSTVDVRSASVPIVATAHITDDRAGAGAVYLCPAHAFPTGEPSFRQAGSCVPMQHASGTRTDATWTATYAVAKGAPSGTWNFALWIDDAAGNAANDFWLGPDELAANAPVAEPRYRAIPHGGGVFTVIGTAQDVSAPELTSVRLTPSVVDTSHGAVQVTADIAATDIEGVTGAGLFISGYAGYPSNPGWVDTVQIAWVQDFHLRSGTARDGVWRATFVVPGGTPDGQYFMQVSLQDSSHFESWITPGSGWVADQLTPELAPTGTFFVVANSPA